MELNVNLDDAFGERKLIKSLLKEVNENLVSEGKNETSFEILKNDIDFCKIRDLKGLNYVSLRNVIQDKANLIMSKDRDFRSFGDENYAKDLMIKLKRFEISLSEFKINIEKSTLEIMKNMAEMSGDTDLPEKKEISHFKPILVDGKRVTKMKFLNKEKENTYNSLIKDGKSKSEALNMIKDKMPSEKIEEKAGKADSHAAKELHLLFENNLGGDKLNQHVKFLTDQYEKRIKKDNFDENQFLQLIVRNISTDMKEICDKVDESELWKNTDNRYALARAIFEKQVKEAYENRQKSIKDSAMIHDGEIDRTVKEIADLEKRLDETDDPEERCYIVVVMEKGYDDIISEEEKFYDESEAYEYFEEMEEKYPDNIIELEYQSENSLDILEVSNM